MIFYVLEVLGWLPLPFLAVSLIRSGSEKKRKLQMRLFLSALGCCSIAVVRLFGLNHFIIVAAESVTAGVYVLCVKELIRERHCKGKRAFLPIAVTGIGVLAVAVSLVAFSTERTRQKRVNKADMWYQEGCDALDEEKYSEAADCFSKAVELDSDNVFYLRDYAIALAREGENGRAEEILREAVKYGLNEENTSLIRAEIDFTCGEYEGTLKELTPILNAWKPDGVTHRAVLLCAKAYQRLGNDRVEQEITLLERSKSLFEVSDSMDLCEQLGWAYARKGEYEAALTELESLYGRGYSTRQMLENLAILYQEVGELSKAEHKIAEMIENDSEDYRGYKRLAFLEADKQQKNSTGNYSAVAEAYDRARELYEQAGRPKDMEMEMLAHMMEELENGQWIPGETKVSSVDEFEAAIEERGITWDEAGHLWKLSELVRNLENADAAGAGNVTDYFYQAAAYARECTSLSWNLLERYGLLNLPGTDGYRIVNYEIDSEYFLYIGRMDEYGTREGFGAWIRLSDSEKEHYVFLGSWSGGYPNGTGWELFEEGERLEARYKDGCLDGAVKETPPFSDNGSPYLYSCAEGIPEKTGQGDEPDSYVYAAKQGGEPLTIKYGETLGVYKAKKEIASYEISADGEEYTVEYKKPY